MACGRDSRFRGNDFAWERPFLANDTTTWCLTDMPRLGRLVRGDLELLALRDQILGAQLRRLLGVVHRGLDARHPQRLLRRALHREALLARDDNSVLNNAVFEVNHDPQPREQWRANLLRAGTIRPHRAVRLENGNTLITDQQKGQVVELDSNSVEVWKVTGLVHPAQAVRLEDGNTLILEQGANRVVEIDPANPRNRTEILKRGLSVPMGMTTY